MLFTQKLGASLELALFHFLHLIWREKEQQGATQILGSFWHQIKGLENIRVLTKMIIQALGLKTTHDVFPHIQPPTARQSK